MNRRLPLLALAVVLGLGFVVLSKSVSAPTEGGGEPSLRAPGGQEEALVPEDAALPSAPEVSAAPEPSKREAAVPVVSAEAADDVLAIPDDSLWYDGRLIFPDRLPLEESFEIVASGRRFGEGRKGPRKHRVEAQPDGRFRVAFAKKTSTGYVALEARYMYLAARERVKPKEGPREIVLSPLLGGILHGQVAAPEGFEADAETFDGIKVSMHEWSSGTTFNKVAEVQADGSYELLGLPPGSEYNLSLMTSRFAGEDRDGVVIRAGEVTELDLALQLGVHLEGRVQDSTGEPVQGARVNLLATHTENGGSSSRSNDMVTDEEGKFTFTGIEPGTMVLSVRAPGATEITDDLGELENGVRRTDLLYSTSAGSSVSGVARWEDGTPAAGVAIAARSVEDDGSLEWNARKYSAKTDEKGEFNLTGLDARSLVIDATGRRKLDETTGLLGRKKRGPLLAARVADVRPGMRGLQIVLGAGDVLLGSVHFVGGGSVGSFYVLARPDWNNQGALDWNDKVERKFSAEDGEFELRGLKPGSWNISVRGKGFAKTEGTVVQVPYDGRLDFNVMLAASMTGTVQTPAGEPMAGAKVTLIEVNGQSRSWTSNGVKTPSDGVFKLKSLEPGRYELRAEAAGWAPSEHLPVTLNSGEEREGLVLVVNPAARLTGQILPGAGEVAGRRVSAWGSGFSDSVMSDSSGHFEFDSLGPGTYTVQLNDSGEDGEEDWHMRRANTHSKSVELLAGGSAHVELGGGPEDPVRVHGKVLSGGVGLAGYAVSFHDGVRDKSAAVRTDEGGAYSTVVDGAGSYAVTVRPAGTEFGVNYNVFQIKVVGDGDQREDFKLPRGSLELTLVRPDGSPAAGALVGLRALDVKALKDNVSSDQQANADGQFVFRHLEPGKYRFRVGGDLNWGEDGGDFARQSADVQIALGASVKREVRLEEGARVSGLASYPDGTPASGLVVRAFNSASEELTIGYQTCDDTGRFDIGGLPAGSVRIQVGQTGSANGERSVQVARGARVQTDISVIR